MPNISLMGAVYSDVPAVDLPNDQGGTTRFYDPNEITPADIGAIAAPTSATDGQFLVYDGLSSAWVARTIPFSQGVSF